MSDLIDRDYAIDDLHSKDPSQIWDTADIEVWINELPSVSPDLSEEDMRLIKKLRSFHNGSYAVVLDKLITSACNKTKQQATVSSDCISRQDAIDAIHEDADWLAAQGSDWQVERMERDKSILMSLPSAEKAQLSGEDATFDCISRQATIDVEGLDEQIRCEMCKNPMRTNRGCDGNCKYDEKLYERIMQMLGERIKPLPSAQPRKKGKWVRADSQCGIGCPFCGTPVDDFCSSIDYINLSYEPNFCPNCGADMKEPFTIPTEIIESVIGYDD